MPRVVLVKRAKVFIWRKVVLSARVTVPAQERQLTHPSCLMLWGRFMILMKMVGGILQRNYRYCKVSLTRVTQEGDCFRYPRLYKWALRNLNFSGKCKTFLTIFTVITRGSSSMNILPYKLYIIKLKASGHKTMKWNVLIWDLAHISFQTTGSC